MHIGIIKLTEPNIINGRIIATDGFSEALRKQSNHKVTIIVPNESEKIDADYVCLKELRQFMEGNPLDVVHYPNVSFYRAMELKRYNAKKLTVTGVTHTLSSFPFMEWAHMLKLAMPCANDGLICTSMAAQETIQKLGINTLNTRVIPLGINPDEFERSPQTNEISNILYFGRFSKNTKMDLKPLLQIFKKVLSKAKAKLIIAGASSGDGYQHEVWNMAKEMGIADDVKLYVDMPDAQKKKIYAMADIFVAPCNNYQETFGLNILEAKAAGLPVVASYWSGYKDLISDGTDGFLIPFKEATKYDDLHELAFLQYEQLNHQHFSELYPIPVDDFAQCILYLIEDKRKRRVMGQRSHTSCERYTWERVIQLYLGYWKYLCEQEQRHMSNGLYKYPEFFSHYPTHSSDALVQDQSGSNFDKLQSLRRE